MHRALLGKSCTHKASAQLNKGILLDFCSWSEKARACQLCTLPLGHLWQHHQMSLLLHDVVLSGRFPFSPFLSWSHCSSKACFAPAKVGCFCRVPSALLPAFALAQMGHPVSLYAPLKPAIRTNKRCISNGLACCWRQSLGLVTADGSSWHPKTVQLQVHFWQACCADKQPYLSRKDSPCHTSCSSQ